MEDAAQLLLSVTVGEEEEQKGRSRQKEIFPTNHLQADRGGSFSTTSLRSPEKVLAGPQDQRWLAAACQWRTEKTSGSARRSRSSCAKTRGILVES